MKALGICGSLVKGGNTEALLEFALQQVNEAGVETQLIRLAGLNISDCNHCNWCLSRQTADRICSISDDMSRLYAPLMAADILFLATPVYLGRMTGPLAVFLDRIRCVEFGSYYRNRLSDKVGAGLAVTWGRNAGVETALLSILEAFLMLDIVPAGAHMSPFGAAAVSSLHGVGKFDPEDKRQVLKDEWGLTTTRMVAQRAIKLARLMRPHSEGVV